ncbi:MAG TPA: potassium-transporting ATPase subunit C [Acidimicrobiales bacterium]|nr:potassium-transporting ATPase subunit C [Acidimicrobiales bacterium]
MLRRQLLTALLVTIVLTIGLGVVYPVVVWGVAQVAFHHQANGSLVLRNGKAVGSSLIGQEFTDKAGNPLLQYFQPRPSAAGNGYDPTASSASNLGPSSPALLAPCLPVPATDSNGKPVVDSHGNPVNQTNPDGSPVCNPNTVPQRVLAYRQLNGLPPGAPVPVDAVTASGSGLDPDISVANALDQANRVATARHLDLGQVTALIRQHTRTRPWGILGENTVNVLDVNLALDKLP